MARAQWGTATAEVCARGSSDAEHRGAHEVLRRLPVHELGHCVWRAIFFVLENPLHGLSENQAPRWPMRICAVLIPCLLEPLPIVGLLSELRATRSSTSMRFPPVALAQGRWAEALHRQLAFLHGLHCCTVLPDLLQLVACISHVCFQSCSLPDHVRISCPLRLLSACCRSIFLLALHEGQGHCAISSRKHSHATALHVQRPRNCYCHVWRLPLTPLITVAESGTGRPQRQRRAR